jgi:cbb3-type cytochrome oxidase subunit 3
MYKDVLRSMEGVELFPSISLILFFTFFLFLVIYLIRSGKSHWDDAAHLPLESEENSNYKTPRS